MAKGISDVGFRISDVSKTRASADSQIRDPKSDIRNPLGLLSFLN